MTETQYPPRVLARLQRDYPFTLETKGSKAPNPRHVIKHFKHDFSRIPTPKRRTLWGFKTEEAREEFRKLFPEFIINEEESTS